MGVDLETHDTFASLATEWDTLADRCAAPPFLRPGWFEAWWSAFGRGRLTILAMRRGGRLVAVAPFARRGDKLCSLANVHTPWFQLLAEDDEAERALARALFRGIRQVAVCSLDRGGSGASRLDDAAREAGRLLLWTPLWRSPYVRLGGDLDALERSLSRKFVADLRRRRRRLADEGAVSVEIAEGGSRLEELLAEAFRIEPSGWKEARRTAIASRVETRRFYTDLAHWAAPAGVLRLAFLRLDGRPIAFEYALDDTRSYWFLKGGVDPEFRRFAPGKLLAHAMIRYSLERGLETFEFLGADEPWKQDWRPEHREIGFRHAFGRSPRALAEGSVVAAYRRCALPVARRMLRWAR